MAQIHIRIDDDLKKQFWATASLNGLSLQDMCLYAIKYTMEEMKKAGLPTATLEGFDTWGDLHESPEVPDAS